MTGRTETVTADGAVITYDVHGDLGAGTPLLIIGSPMAAGDFQPLVDQLGDRPMITYDPRGVDRSPKDDSATFSTPEQHAADLQLIVDRLGLTEVDVFASSGGAVNALAWVVATGPVRTVVAHEPPIYSVLPDHAEVTAVAARMSDTYDREGFGPAMAQFLTLVMHVGPFTETDADAPAPNPAVFGLPTTDDGGRTDPLLWQNRPCTAWQPDLEALRSSRTRIMIGVGDESGEVVTGRAALALAGLLGSAPTTFPGGHGGFGAAEGPGGGDPAAFAVRLREVLG